MTGIVSFLSTSRFPLLFRRTFSLNRDFNFCVPGTHRGCCCTQVEKDSRYSYNSAQCGLLLCTLTHTDTLTHIQIHSCTHTHAHTDTHTQQTRTTLLKVYKPPASYAFLLIFPFCLPSVYAAYAWSEIFAYYKSPLQSKVIKHSHNHIFKYISEINLFYCVRLREFVLVLSFLMGYVLLF